MGAHSLLAALCAIGCSQLAAGSEGPGGPVSLVQRVVRVHETEEEMGTGEVTEEEEEEAELELPDAVENLNTIGTYVLTNDNLVHSGPGVRYRLATSMDATADSMEKYMPWGTVFNGTSVGEGFVKYNDYYLPLRINGKEVVQLVNIIYDPREPEKPKEPMQAPQTNLVRSQPKRSSNFHYASTEVQTPFGGWAPCKVLRAGSKEGTYDIEVHPSTFAPYTVKDVPAASLKKVKKVHEFLPVTPADAQVTKLSMNLDSSISLTVNNTKTNTFTDLKMLRKSPMRTLMKMACERAGLTWFKCDHDVKFVWHNKPMNQDDHTYELGMKDGDLIDMLV